MLHSNLGPTDTSASVEYVQGLFSGCDAGVKDNVNRYVDNVFFDRVNSEAEISRLKTALEEATTTKK